MHVARPKSFFRMNSITACASAVLSTTMASSMPQAVETATSYFFGIVPKSPKRPCTPWSCPAEEASLTARISLDRVCSSSNCDLASSALARVALTAFDASSIWPATSCNRALASEVKLRRSAFNFAASVASCCRVFSREEQSVWARLSSSICSATCVVFSRRNCASVCATETTFCTSVRRCCNGTSAFSFDSLRGRSFSALPFKPA
mmetsp:Transcript_126527/g.366289  ORF Transcript_126527/g.366289 Transcript_126527/m.366289 type:complete len:206 (-) Transcript_126527:1779-2396(-)